MPCQTLSGVGSYRKRLVEPEMQPLPQLVGSSIADIGSRNLGSFTKCQEALKPEERTETLSARMTFGRTCLGWRPVGSPKGLSFFPTEPFNRKTSLGSISRIRSMGCPSGGTSPQMLIDLLDDVRFRNYSHHRVDVLAVLE